MADLSPLPLLPNAIYGGGEQVPYTSEGPATTLPQFISSFNALSGFTTDSTVNVSGSYSTLDGATGITTRDHPSSFCSSLIKECERSP